MIALPEGLPYVVWKNERLLPLSESWIAESIQLAASITGYEKWDLTFHIARAVTAFIEEEFEGATITISQLEGMISISIEQVGYAEIARALVLAAPRLSISLAEIADRTHYELLFYPMLRTKLDEAMAIEARGVIFGDLKPCVKILDQAARWRQTCEELRGQIVQYIRDYLAASPERRLDFAIV